jgi:hypothetical protein
MLINAISPVAGARYWRRKACYKDFSLTSGIPNLESRR